MKEIKWSDFENIQIVTGTIISAKEFTEAKKQAYILEIDFGNEIGIKRSSAQIKDLYKADELIGKQIIAVINLPAKQIGPFMSECLITGFVQDDNSVILAIPDKIVENGLKLS